MDTSPDDRFDWQIPCILWYLKNNETVSYDQAQAACSMHKSVEELTTVNRVIYWLTAILILIPNVAMFLGIIGTRKLHKPLYFYMANLAASDVLTGIGLMCYSETWKGMGEGMTGLYVLMNIMTLFLYSQLMSASALALLSIDSYVAVRHPIYFHTHAHIAKRNAGIAMASSWIVLTLLTFTPSMGWNCLDMTISECSQFFPRPFIGLVGAIIILFAIIMLFTNTSVYLAIRQRQKNRLGQPVETQPLQGNNPAQNVAGNPRAQNVVQNEADRKFQRSVRKARTVLIHVMVACIFLLVPLALGPICDTLGEKCTLPVSPQFAVLVLTLNSVINPIVSIVRTPDLRKAIWEKLVAIQRALRTVMRGNRVNPQEDQPAHGNALELQAAAAVRSKQTTSSSQQTEGQSKTVVNQTGERLEAVSFTPNKSENLAIVEID
ncbi:PREDICTED: sphingosine 1-phosphate receptor 1-like [Branchiostoma belcheri]|uniref:Sphingosine 1-phosphate receptor 1-like n=1 Tax=Branchiostoma belcheri TaxID=7741 RepID=A0A6P4XZ16_BRABE|nr:PREDICTED: sphingosine 1-phosphate receptor 1-like [Branchiostoma belcheri]